MSNSFLIAFNNSLVNPWTIIECAIRLITFRPPAAWLLVGIILVIGISLFLQRRNPHLRRWLMILNIVILPIGISCFCYELKGISLYGTRRERPGFVAAKALPILAQAETLDGLVKRLEDSHEDEYVRYYVAKLVGEKLRGETVETKTRVFKNVENAL